MSITSRINEMSSHIEQAYDELQGLGADLTNVDKNIENISMVLDDIYDSMPQVSGEGTSLTLDDTRAGKIKSTLKGNTSQSGTPTPTSPIPINVVSGNNKVLINSKNVFNLSDKPQTTHSNGITYKVENNVISLSGTNTSSSSYSLISWTDNATENYYNDLFQKGRTFTLSANNNIAGVYFQFNYYKEGSSSQSQLANFGNLGSKITFTIPNDFSKVGSIFIGIYGTATTINGDFSFQLEKGNDKTTFEPYQESNTYNIDLPEGMELCSSQDGTIGDYFLHDKTTDKWYLYKIIYKKIFNDTDTITIVGSSETRTLISYNTGITLESYAGGSAVPNILCTHLISASQAATWVPGDISRRSQDPMSLFYILEAGLTTTTALQWLVNNNVVTYTPMAEPIATEITYQPLIDQLNLLEKAMSKDGQTNISQVNNDLPFIISASALKEWQENTSLNSTLSMVNPLSLGNTLNTQENDIQPIEVDNIEPLEEEENE